MLWLAPNSTTTSLFFAVRRASSNSSMLWTCFTLSSLSAFLVLLGAAVAFTVKLLVLLLVSSFIIRGLGFVKDREDEKTEDKALILGGRDEGGLDKKFAIVAMEKVREGVVCVWASEEEG